MNRTLIWRGALIALVLAVSLYSAYPLDERLSLGLDLQGGIHLVLKVKVEDAVRSESTKDMDRLIQELRDAGQSSANATQNSSTGFDLTGIPRDQDDEVTRIVTEYLPGWNWQRSGETVKFSMEIANAAEIRNLAVVQALETIRNRIDEFGVAEPVIQRQGLDGDRIVVQLPGVDDPERV